MLPGLALATLYIVVVAIIARLRPQWTPKVPAMPLVERLRAAAGLWKLAVLFFIAVVGIYLGWFSPTEAAAIAAFTAAAIGFATRTLTLGALADALLDTVYSTAMLFFIIVGAFIFSRFVVLTRLPNELVAWVHQAGFSPLLIVVAVVLLYFLLGTFLEEVSTILITVPVILPLMASVGYDAIWFGIFVTVMATIGLISPPVGLTILVELQSECSRHRRQHRSASSRPGGLGVNLGPRHRAYRQLFNVPLADSLVQEIRACTRDGRRLSLSRKPRGRSKRQSEPVSTEMGSVPIN